MKGIFLTEEAKQEIEAKIVKLEKNKYKNLRMNIYVYKEILLSATILPVEESWNQFNMSNNSLTLQNKKIWYPNGVIIQPKQ